MKDLLHDDADVLSSRPGTPPRVATIRRGASREILEAAHGEQTATRGRGRITDAAYARPNDGSAGQAGPPVRSTFFYGSRQLDVHRLERRRIGDVDCGALHPQAPQGAQEQGDANQRA
jgi:hypothetical protein